MNYADIPVSERIKYAAEYCLILKDDTAITPEKIIAELAITFFLTNEEASAAYLLSKKQFAEEYKKSNKRKAWHYITTICASLVIGIFYLLMASEQGFGYFIIFALLFFISILGVFNLILNNVSEEFLLKYPHFKSLKKNLIFQTLPVTFFFCIGLLGEFMFKDIIKQEDIVLKPFTLSAKIESGETGGRSSQYYYKFSITGYEKNFRFTQSDYLFADPFPDVNNYNIGDTVYLEVLKTDVADLRKITAFSKYNRIIGMEINDKSIINYKSRHDRILQKRENWLTVAVLAFVINIVLALLWINYKRKQYARHQNDQMKF